MKKFLVLLSIVLSIILVIGIPIVLYYLFPKTSSATWIDFSGGYIGSIVGVIIAAILALITSQVEGKKQRKEFQVQLREQKRTDIEVQNTYLKNKLIIEKKSEVIYDSMILMQNLPKLHSFVFNSLDNEKNVDKTKFDYIEEKILESIENIGKNKAYIADRIELYQGMLTNIFDYISTIRKFVPAEITRQNEIKEDRELVEIDRKDLEDFIEEIKVETNELKSKDKRSTDVVTNFLDMYLVSEDQVEAKYKKTKIKIKIFYKTIDKDVYTILKSF